MKNHRTFLFSLMAVISSCANDTNGRSDAFAEGADTPIVEIGGDYEIARERILTAGWVAIPAECSEKNLCLDHVELATDLDTGATCGKFMKEGKGLIVCVIIIPDGARLKSVNLTSVSK